MLATGSESPVVVVLSGSMEPALYRGDAIFLSMTSSPVEPGEIVVFKLAGRDVPIVHDAVHDGHVSASEFKHNNLPGLNRG